MRLGHTCKVFGIDPWEAAVKRVKSKISIYGINNIEIIVGEAENIPLENNSIDLITSNNGINNVSNIPKVLKELGRITKSGGQFVQTLNLNTSMIEFYCIMEDVLTELNLVKEKEKLRDHIYEKRKPLDEIIAIIEENGFSVDNVIDDQFRYKFADGTTMFNHYFIQLAFLSAWKNIVSIDQQREIFCRVEQRINEKAEIEGCFQLSIPFVLIDCTKN